MLVNAIIKKLKTGSIPNVVLFSDVDAFPEMPYVCVKPESGSREGTRQYRIIVHASQGQYDTLDDYVHKELPKLLTQTIDDEDGTRYKLYSDNFTDVMAEPEDNTYFVERVYYAPLVGFN